MSYRTTIVLDEASQQAARELASHFNCSTSEAIRRALLGFRDLTHGVSAGERRRRLDALYSLIDLFEGHDADEELRRLKAEDAGF